MAGDAANLVLGAIIEKTITPMVDAIGRHLGYLFCYKSNIKNLEERVNQLEKSRNDADRFFKEQIRKNEETAESSKWWQGEVEKVIKDAKEIEEAATKLKGCLNLKGRYVQSRKSTKLVVKIQTLHNKAPEGITTNIILPAGSLTGAQANNYSEGYKTRMQTMDEVMKALEDPAISVIGLCGLGGVGKTTMVHEVRERAREQKLFDEVAMTTVSQNQDLFKIQGDLAEMLGLTSLKEETNIIGRADHLRKRLTGGNKVPIILDDVWRDIKLADVGIPFGSGETKCKVVITSRHTRVCADTQKNIEVRVLAIDEARSLFRKTAGECVEMNNLGKIADEIADECRGLPIALLTLSRALSNYKDSRAWEDARASMREGSSISIPGMEKEVYQSIKLSYDFLATEKQEEAQSLLLLCCQHQEDVEIKVEMLARYCLSLELFEGVTGVVHARNRVCRLIEQLKSCFLLQAVGAADDEDIQWRDEAVKVHDVVRDVCLSMVSRDEADRDRVYMHIMEEEIDDTDKIGTGEEIDDADKIGTSEVDHPKIKLLMMPRGVPLHPTPSRQQMEELRVLEIFSTEDFGPGPFQFPTNLRMLSLGGGLVHPHIASELSMLTELEVLSFNGSRIKSLTCIGKLRNLKLLDLRCTFQTRMDPIPSGILPGLTKLEVLYMGSYYFADKNLSILRDSTGLRGTETCISELDSLRNLTTLQIFLSNPMELLELKHLSFEKLERFHFCTEASYVDCSQSLCPLVLKTLQLKEVGIEWVFGDKIQSIIERTVHLFLEYIKHWTDPLIIEQFASLRKLDISRCHKLEYIIHDGDGIDNATHSGGGPSSSSSCSVFKNLEILTIKDMRTLKELCHNGYLLEGSLYKLRELQLYNLPIMRHLWVGPTNPQCLVNLTNVKIMKCVALECIFPHSAAKCLVHIQEITVKKCSKLKGIMSKSGEETATGIETNIKEETNKLLIHFPMLRRVTINESFDFRGFYNLEDGREQPLFNPLVMLPRIEKLDVSQLHQLKQIAGGKMPGFPTLAAANWLQNLKNLSVEDCKSLESVFDFEGQQVMGEENTHVVTLSKLKEIELACLPNLIHIFRCPLQYISVPELQRIRVDGCHGLVNGFPSNLIMGLQNLVYVFVANCKSLKSVFDFEGVEAMTIIKDAGSLLCELQAINLQNLPRLEHLCRQVPKEVHSIFQNLTKLQVEYCDGLAYLIPSSIAHMLVNLQELDVKSCKGMKEVVYNMNEDDYSELEKKVVFRSLTSVELEDLGNLLSFCSSDQQVFEFPSLEKLSIIHCPEIETFCCQIPSVACNGMSGGNVSKGEGTSISGEGETNKVPLPTDLVAQFPKLKEVILEGRPKFPGLYNIDNDYDWLLPLHHPLETSKAMKALFAPLIIPSQDALLAPIIVSPSPLVADNSESDLNEDGIVDSAAAYNAEGFDDNHDDDDGAVANHVDSSDAVDEHVNDPNISEERDHDQNVQHDNEDTSCTLMKAVSAPLVGSSPSASLAQVIVSPSPLVSDNNEELAYSSSVDLKKIVLPHVIQIVPSSDSPVRHFNPRLLTSGTSCSTSLNQATSKPTKDLLASAAGSSPAASLAPTIVSLSSPSSDNNEEFAHSSTLDLENFALPGLTEFVPSASSGQSVPSSDYPAQTNTGKTSSNPSLSSSDADWTRSRILIRGVYIKAVMKTTFEEILTANPNFLSGLRFKKAEIKTVFVESAISSLQCLRQYTARTMHEEQLTSIKEFLDDLAPSGLDITWLERGYQRASLVMKEQKAVLAAKELARLERKKVEAEDAFEMAKAKLEEVMSQRDASKAECDALLQEVEAGKELFGGGFDQEASLGDGLLN